MNRKSRCRQRLQRSFRKCLRKRSRAKGARVKMYQKSFNRDIQAKFMLRMAQISLGDIVHKVSHLNGTHPEMNCVSFEIFHKKKDSRHIGNLQSFQQIKALTTEAGIQIQFSETSPIQRVAIPLIMMGFHVIGVAPTGSGKTLAFLVPTLLKVLGRCFKKKKSLCIALLPSRILAMQVVHVFRDLVNSKEVRLVSKGLGRALADTQALCAVGGTDSADTVDSMAKFLQRAQSGTGSFLFGTPAKVHMMLTKRSKVRHELVNCVNESLTTLILDEVDRLFDMGCTEQFLELMQFFPDETQRLYFTATLHKEIENNLLTPLFLENGVKVVVSHAIRLSSSVKQNFILVKSQTHRQQMLHMMLEKKLVKGSHIRKAVVFCNSINETEKCFSELSQSPILAPMARFLHSSIDNAKRVQYIRDMHSDPSARILIATDIASRGIDIDTIDLVVNYSFPFSLVDYIHRGGRTGRADRTGEIVSFLSVLDNDVVPEICTMLEEQGSQVPPDLAFLRQSLRKRQKC